MELREFCQIFLVRWRIFFGVFAAVLLVSLLSFRFQPERYETSLLLNVARSGRYETTGYTYDQFYRLQADERFADTVVRWIGEPSVREMIRKQAGAEDEAVDTLSAKRLSSQVIHVDYRAKRPSGFGRMAEVVPAVLNESSERIDAASEHPDWFTLVADEPVVRDARLSLGFLLGFGAVVGLFAGFWAVLAAWYFAGGIDGKK